MSTQTDWLELSPSEMSIEVEAIDGPRRCHICEKVERGPRTGDPFQVLACNKCDEPTCQDCAEMDYDMQGDPGGYVCVQWDCPTCLKG